MAWKTDNGQPVFEAGNPVWVEDDKELPVDYSATIKKISELNEESKQHRLKAKELSEKIAKYEGIDPEKARQAMETVQNLDAKKLVDANQIDVLKKQWAEESAKTIQKYEQEKAMLAEGLQKERKARESLVKRQMFSNSKTSGFLNRVNLTPDVAFALWGDRFKVENDTLIPMIDSETPLPSSDPLKNHASFEEGIEKFFNQYEYKDNYLKQPPGGSGSGGNATSGRGVFTITRADAHNPAKYRAVSEAAAKAGATVQLID